MDCIEPRTPFRPRRRVNRDRQGSSQQVEDFCLSAGIPRPASVSLTANCQVQEEATQHPLENHWSSEAQEDSHNYIEQKIEDWLLSRHIMSGSVQDKQNQFFETKRNMVSERMVNRLLATPKSSYYQTHSTCSSTELPLFSPIKLEMSSLVMRRANISSPLPLEIQSPLTAHPSSLKLHHSGFSAYISGQYTAGVRPSGKSLCGLPMLAPLSQFCLDSKPDQKALSQKAPKVGEGRSDSPNHLMNKLEEN